MQQLQSSYGGDRSDTLAQIFGLDYDPQGQMAAMAQQMLSTGMGSSTQLKTRVMADNAMMNRDFLARQYAMNDSRRIRQETLSDKLMARDWALQDAARTRGEVLADKQMARGYEVEDRNLRREDAQIAKDEKAAREEEELAGAIEGAMANLDIFINALGDVDDPETKKERELLLKQKQYLIDNVLNGTGTPAQRRARIMAVGRTGQLEPQTIVRFKTLYDEAERRRKEAEAAAAAAKKAADDAAAGKKPNQENEDYVPSYMIGGLLNF